MVDSVNIENVGGDQGIASEITLKRLLVTMELMANKTGKDGADAVKKAKEQYKKSIEELDKTTEKTTKSKKKYKDTVEKTTEATKKYTDVLSGLVTGALGSFSGSILGLANEFVQGGNQLQDFTQHLPIIGGYLAPFADFIDRSVSTFRELTQVGSSFGNSITEMRTSAARVGLTLDELGSLIASNSETLRVLGGTVNEGVKRFEDINKVMKSTNNFDGLMRLGFTVEEVNEGLLSYVELQTRLGRNERRSNQDLAKSSTEYMKQLDLLARVTGKSRKEAEQAMLAQSQDAGFRALADQFASGSKELENFQFSMAMLEGLPQNVAAGLKDLADGVPQTEDAIALVNTAGPELMHAMEQIAQGADPQVLVDAISEAGHTIEGWSGATGRERKLLIESLRSTNPAIAGMLDAATEMQRMKKIDVAQARKDQELNDETSESLLTFENTVRKIRSSLQIALIDSGLLGAVADGAAYLSETMSSDTFKKSVGRFIDLFKEGMTKLQPYFTGFVEGVKKFAETFGDNPTKAIEEGIKDIGSGIATVVVDLAKGFVPVVFNAVKDALIDGFKSIMQSPYLIDKVALIIGGSIGALMVKDKVVSMFGGGRQSSKAPSKAGASLGGIGTGIGKGLGGVLKGLANGLAAAGAVAPKMLIGAAAIGTSIGLIGAGIAGASWLLGKALPTFIDGIKGFEDLDGRRLAETALGMTKIAGAMAAFGAGSAVAGLGNLIGNIGEGLSKAIGGDGPLEKLQKFSEAEIDLLNVKKNAFAMKQFAEAMSALTPQQTSILGSISAGISEGLDGFFGTSSPLDKLEEFGKRQLDVENIIKNASAVKAFGGAFETLARSESAEFDLDTGFVMRLESLAEMDGSGLRTTARGMQAIADVRGFESKIEALKGLDARDVDSYRKSLDKLVDTLENLNEQLGGGDDGGWFGGNDKPETTAGDVLGQMNTNRNNNDVNTTDLLSVLREIRDLNRRTLRAINAQSGTVH